MPCCIKGVVINEVPKFLAPVPTETTQAIQILNPFNATHSIFIPFWITRVTSYFDVRKLKKSMRVRITSTLNSWWKIYHGICQAWVQYAKAEHAWLQGMFCYPHHSSKDTIINQLSVSSYAHDAADVMNDNNFAIVLESVSLYHHCK